MTSVTKTRAWNALAQHYQACAERIDVRQAFAQDAQRLAQLSQQAPFVFADLSKNLVDAHTERLLLELAQERGVLALRDAMFAGARINNTEHRASMHWLLRAPSDAQIAPALHNDLHGVHRVLDDTLAFAESTRANAQITDVVNIGIGGSYLGPQMATHALEHLNDSCKRIHFVSNIDGNELAQVLKLLNPQTTLFLVASKTFTTLETMTNAYATRQWFVDAGGKNIAAHFVAMTAHAQAAAAFGISTTFPFWDWVGGRYSLWSAVGLSLAIAVGAERFRQLLAGAYAMDRHFCTAPAAQNLPLRLGLLDVWYRNFHGFHSRCIAPYHSALRRLPAYLQQLEMESNGKRVDRQGRALLCASAPILWGETGSDGQHAFFQMLHQGTETIPVEFIAVQHATHHLYGSHNQLLLASALAQAQALMQGREDSENAHKHFPGNRPSTFLLLEHLDPASLGALLALYEHRVFVSGAVWDINSFDQWGVELGKALTQNIAPRLSTGDTSSLDPSTAGLVQKIAPTR